MAEGWAVLSASLQRRAQGFLMGGHTEPPDGGRSTRAAFCLTHCSSLVFPHNADSMHSSAEHTGPTVARDAAFVEVSVANAASQHGSPLGLTGDAGPMKGD